MPEPPAAASPRRDPTAADTTSLVALGREEPPPIPAPVFQEPVYPSLPNGYAPDEPA
ncbi:hypothetical protein ABZ915_17865 [Streptomyces sp. NPDC046915]|uniref:hypothetical protein n=1 Tax=Streptomyces sp. NPDC046915 TaxID=3155257 RepID=UPI0033E214E0